MIVADDENLDIAASYGFDTVERDNTDLGRRFNAGYQHAAAQGADIFVHVGSDDWIHPDVFDILETTDLSQPPKLQPRPGQSVVWRQAPQLVAQRRLLLIDLEHGVGQRCFTHSACGCIPWLIPRNVLAPSRFAPIPPGQMRGIDGALAAGLRTRPNWVFQDAPDEWCVDFKTDINVTPYKGVARTLANGPEEEPWPLLSDFYPGWLVDKAKTTTA